MSGLSTIYDPRFHKWDNQRDPKAIQIPPIPNTKYLDVCDFLTQEDSTRCSEGGPRA